MKRLNLDTTDSSTSQSWTDAAFVNSRLNIKYDIWSYCEYMMNEVWSLLSYNDLLFCRIARVTTLPYPRRYVHVYCEALPSKTDWQEGNECVLHFILHMLSFKHLLRFLARLKRTSDIELLFFLPLFRREEERGLQRGQLSIGTMMKPSESDDSLVDYGDGGEIPFNEDGSFIGQYTGTRRDVRELEFVGGLELHSPMNTIYSLAWNSSSHAFALCAFSLQRELRPRRNGWCSWFVCRCERLETGAVTPSCIRRRKQWKVETMILERCLIIRWKGSFAFSFVNKKDPVYAQTDAYDELWSDNGCTSEETEVDQFIMLIKAVARTHLTTVTAAFLILLLIQIISNNEICVTFILKLIVSLPR